MRFISLAAGIGGFDLGLESAGMICVAQVEIDPWCQRVLQKHWPNVPKFGDIRNVGKNNLPTTDLICAGFPCQPFSYAGKQQGKKDDRNLWPEVFRVINECKPRWAVLENVPGIIALYIDRVLSDLEGLGYTCQSFIIPACAFDARHRRDRAWIVANTFNDGLYREKGNEAIKGKDKQKNGVLERVCSWPTEPGVGRVAYGVSGRVDRLRGLGNAVVPQAAEHIGRLIMRVEGLI